MARKFLVIGVFVSLTACNPVSSDSPATQGDGGLRVQDPGGPTQDGGPHVQDAGPLPEQSLGTKWCALAISRNCPGPFAQSGTIQAQCEQAFATASGRGCGAGLERGYSCAAPAGAAGMGCLDTPFGALPIASSTGCAVDHAAGMACLISTNDLDCFGLPCNYDADCPSNHACNSATSHCFRRDALCGGLPCKYNVDCPSDSRCNSAAGLCTLE